MMTTQRKRKLRALRKVRIGGEEKYVQQLARIRNSQFARAKRIRKLSRHSRKLSPFGSETGILRKLLSAGIGRLKRLSMISRKRF